MDAKEYRITTGESKLFGRVYKAELVWVNRDGSEEGDPVISVSSKVGRLFLFIDVDTISALAEVLGEKWCSVLRDMVSNLVGTMRGRENAGVVKTVEGVVGSVVSIFCNR